VADEDILGYLEELQKKQNLVGFLHIKIYVILHYTYDYGTQLRAAYRLKIKV